MKIVIFAEDKNIFLNLIKEIEKNDLKIETSSFELLSTSELEKKEISFKNDVITINNINSYKNFSNTNVAIFCVRKELTEKYVYDFIENNCVVIDGSSYFLDDENIPLIDFNINRRDIGKYKNKNLIKLPSQSTIQLVEILSVMNQVNNIKKVVLSTYQSTSTLGKKAMDELYLHTKKIYENAFLPQVNFKKQIPFNVIPQIGDIGSNNHYEEEERIIKETKTILNTDIEMSATCVLVPVFSGNCQSVNIEFENDITKKDIEKIFNKNCDTITIRDRFEEFNYATPKETVLEDTIFVSRIRNSLTSKNTVNLWTVADNMLIYSKNIIKILFFLLEKIKK